MDVIPQSKYLKFFQEHQDKIKSYMEATGDIMLIERMKFPEAKTKTGIILATEMAAAKTLNGIGADKPTFFRILHVGAGFVNDDGTDLPLDVKPGDIALLGAASVKMFSLFPLLESYEPDSIGIARETDIQLRFHGEENFIQFLRDFNEATQAQVECGS